MATLGDCTAVTDSKAPTLLGPLRHASFCFKDATSCVCDAVFLSCVRGFTVAREYWAVELKKKKSTFLTVTHTSWWFEAKFIFQQESYTINNTLVYNHGYTLDRLWSFHYSCMEVFLLTQKALLSSLHCQTLNSFTINIINGEVSSQGSSVIDNLFYLWMWLVFSPLSKQPPGLAYLSNQRLGLAYLS